MCPAVLAADGLVLSAYGHGLLLLVLTAYSFLPTAFCVLLSVFRVALNRLDNISGFASSTKLIWYEISRHGGNHLCAANSSWECSGTLFRGLTWKTKSVFGAFSKRSMRCLHR